MSDRDVLVLMAESWLFSSEAVLDTPQYRLLNRADKVAVMKALVDKYKRIREEKGDAVHLDKLGGIIKAELRKLLPC